MCYQRHSWAGSVPHCSNPNGSPTMVRPRKTQPGHWSRRALWGRCRSGLPVLSACSGRPPAGLVRAHLRVRWSPWCSSNSNPIYYSVPRAKGPRSLSLVAARISLPRFPSSSPETDCRDSGLGVTCQLDAQAANGTKTGRRGAGALIYTGDTERPSRHRFLGPPLGRHETRDPDRR